jgi:hypothetical protein
MTDQTAPRLNLTPQSVLYVSDTDPDGEQISLHCEQISLNLPDEAKPIERKVNRAIQPTARLTLYRRRSTAGAKVRGQSR